MNNSGLDGRIKELHMMKLADYRKNDLRLHPRLHSLFFELTPFCNEHCLHCGSRCGDIETEGLLTLDDYKHILNEVKRDFDISKMMLCITGGEPLLRHDFFEIMSYANLLGFNWGMTSNGTLITDEIADKLKETGMKTISISVDGLRENHEWFRQSRGSFDKTIEAVKRLVVRDFTHVQITTVVYHKNIDELEKMYDEFFKLGIKSWRVINIEPIGRALDNPSLLLSKAEYRYLFDFIERKRFAGKMEVTYGCSHYLGIELEREVRKWYFLCNAGVYTASIMYNGNIGACLDIERRPELVEGNIKEDRLKDIWENGFKIYRTDYRKTGKCAECPEYEYCVGDSFHTWNFDEGRPNICMKEILADD